MSSSTSSSSASVSVTGCTGRGVVEGGEGGDRLKREGTPERVRDKEGTWRKGVGEDEKRRTCEGLREDEGGHRKSAVRAP